MLRDRRTQLFDFFRLALNGQFDLTDFLHLSRHVLSITVLWSSKLETTYQIHRPPVLFRSLLQTLLTHPDLPVTIVHECINVVLVFLLERGESRVERVGSLGFLERFGNLVRVEFGTGTHVHFLNDHG